MANFGDIIITEIMINPAAVADTAGEYFEVFNTTDAPIDLAGWMLSDQGTDAHTITGSLIIPPGGLLVLGRDGNPVTNGGVTVNYVYSNISFVNTADSIILRDASGALVDSVAYNTAAGWLNTNGQSLELINRAFNAAANDAASNWVLASQAFGVGDFGTPGSFNNTSSAPTSGDDFLFGTGGADVINLLDGNDSFGGFDGADQINGGAGADTLHGGANNDTLNGGTGSDFIFGDAGQDVIILNNGILGDFDNINGGTERDLLDMTGLTNGAIWIDFGYNVISGPNTATGFNLSTAAGDARVVQMDSMYGTSFNDTMRGDAGSNLIDGGAGDDTLLSYSPYDTVTPYSSLGDVMLGGIGNDLLFSGTGNDYLDGGADNDTIEVGAGTDTVITGTGNDIVFFSPNCGTDTVTDFTGGPGVVDVLKLYGFGTAFDTAAEVKAAASQHGLDTWIMLPGTTIILQNFTATTLANDDFVFV
jgi:Ca2+-binding RTX toxin-like protein